MAVDFLGAEPSEGFLADALAAEPGSFVEGAPLVYMKLKSPRHKDRTDVIELVKAGLDVAVCRNYLSAHAPSFVPLFDDAVQRAAPKRNSARAARATRARYGYSARVRSVANSGTRRNTTSGSWSDTRSAVARSLRAVSGKSAPVRANSARAPASASSSARLTST